MTSSDLPTTPPSDGLENQADGTRAAAQALADEQGGRPVWIWTGDGGSMILSNAEGLSVLGLDTGSDPSEVEVKPSVPARRSLQAVGRMPVGGNGRGRIEILRISVGGRHETLVATCSAVDLAGTVGILALGTAPSTRSITPALPDMTDTQTELASGEALAMPTTETPSEPLTEPMVADEAAPSRPEAVPSPQDLSSTVDDDPFLLSIDVPNFAPDPLDAGPSEADVLVEEGGAIDDAELPANDDDVAGMPITSAAVPVASAFLFQPRTRPHRFSFKVDQDGCVRSLSSGMAEAVGAKTALRDGDLAHETVRRADPQAPHIVLVGLEARERFAEHRVRWPVEGTDLTVPIHLSAFGEDDGELRVFGTVETDRAEPEADSEMSTPLPAEETSPTDISVTSAVQGPSDQTDGPVDMDAAPSPEAPEALQPTSTSMQFPGGARLAEATAAFAAGLSAGLQRRPPTPEDEPSDVGVTHDEQADEQPEARDGDGTLSEAGAAAAGLYARVDVERDDGVASENAEASDTPASQNTDTPDEEVPADIARGMQAVAAGVSAGLGADTLAALQDDQNEEGPVDDDGAAGGVLDEPDEDDQDPTEPEADIFDTSSPDPSLVRPERLTFQEIARRLGARIAHQVIDPEPSAPRDERTKTNDRQDPTAHLVDVKSDLEFRPGQADVISLEKSPGGPDGSPGPSDSTDDERGSAQVLPFTRTEPNAERMVLDRLPLGIIIYSEDAILYANRAALEMAGQHSMQALKAYRGIEALFTEGFEAEDGAMTLVQPNGARVPVTGRLQGVRWEGRAAALLSLREDHQADRLTEAATETPADDAALSLVKARIGELEAIVDLASDGVVTLQGDGTIKDINQAAQALVGYSTDDLGGRPFRLLFAEDSRQIALDYLDDIASQGRLSLFNEGREVECLSAQGGLVPVFMTLGRLTDDEPATYCAVLRDLSPFKQAEDDLVAARHAAEEANAHKSDFLARVSHEIRTPLNAVIGFSEVMLEERFGPVGSERYRQYLHDIHTSGEHLMSLLNDLLDLSKIEAGKMDLSFGEVDLNDIAQQSLAIMQPQASQGRIIVRTSLPQSLPKVVADVRSIRQIVLNLISNAIKFTDAGGQIIVSTLYEPTGEVSLRVRDTGRGMSEADVQLAMEPFRQVPTTLNQVITGTGLGLPLTKALVEANKAQFALESTPGEGTLVKVTFPLQRVLAE
ncbi:MAG: ATP-binding protein [Pseudomonadota bacterium]